MSLTPEPHGVVHGLDIRDYHAGPGISKSGLDDIDHSPAFFKAMRSSNAPAREETPSQLVGNLAHCAILEPAEFVKRYASLPSDAPRRPTDAQWNAKAPSDESKAAMAWWTEWNAAHAGTTVISAAQHKMALGMSDSMRRLKDVHAGLSMSELLSRGRPEVSAYWKDPDTGMSCRCRPDWVHPLNKKQAVILDVKTVGDATAHEFSRQVHRMRYHVQDAFYTDGFAAAARMEVVAFIFVVVEDKWPYAAASYQLGDESRHEGYLQYRQNLDLYASCVKSGIWPGLAPRTTVIDLPPYALTPVEEELSWSES